VSARSLSLGALLVVAIACASTPRPPVLSEADAVRGTPAAAEARSLAPQAFAKAERILEQARAAHDQGSPASAQILGEHALAGYGHAFVLARLAKAEQRMGEAELALRKAKSELAALDEKQRFVAAEADDLEKRVRMLEDALPLAPNVQASPEREKARLEAARAMASQARLLCLAARLLEPNASGLADSVGKLDALDQELAKTQAPVPIDEAIRMRSACLKHLTLVRRDRSRSAPAAGLADALLAELSRAGDLLPFRDDRGVVVVLRGSFTGAGATPSKELAERLALLGRVAKAHPEFPVLVVVHSAKGRSAADEQRAKTVADALRQAGAKSVETHAAGSAQPVAAPDRAGAASRNQRLEIVFVAPTG
jgi:flagellar motor protein MotB